MRDHPSSAAQLAKRPTPTTHTRCARIVASSSPPSGVQAQRHRLHQPRAHHAGHAGPGRLHGAAGAGQVGGARSAAVARLGPGRGRGCSGRAAMVPRQKRGGLLKRRPRPCRPPRQHWHRLRCAQGGGGQARQGGAGARARGEEEKGGELRGCFAKEQARDGRGRGGSGGGSGLCRGKARHTRPPPDRARARARPAPSPPPARRATSRAPRPWRSSAATSAPTCAPARSTRCGDLGTGLDRVGAGPGRPRRRRAGARGKGRGAKGCREGQLLGAREGPRVCSGPTGGAPSFSRPTVPTRPPSSRRPPPPARPEGHRPRA